MELSVQYSDGLYGWANFSCFGCDYKYSFVDHKFYEKDNHGSAIWQEITENDYRRAEYLAWKRTI